MAPDPEAQGYQLDEQVGFLLRKANQRHQTIFAARIPGNLTSMQFSTLFRLASEPGPVSQNALGRMVAMDAATTKGVVTRLKERGLIAMEPDPGDRRRYILSTTAEGRALLQAVVPVMQDITRETLAPLTPAERGTLVDLLKKLC
ncbi:MarR family winged helix-turn-helix transcriptional regulator [Paenirhodobacter sp.]|uniref:MarR family winged helix-turn-helix transcriptional regulator n=1 Tax=Paenirhodobacter sp. TaxID=1965326 RepID=UPI003B3DBF86